MAPMAGGRSGASKASSNSSSGAPLSSSAYDAFNSVDERVSKPVFGSDGAANWQSFRRSNNKTSSGATVASSSTSTTTSAAPKAPLKAADRAAGIVNWQDERQREDQSRRDAGKASLEEAGYAYFEGKKDDDKPQISGKRKREIEGRIRPKDLEYFLPSKTFQGHKFDYVFTTKTEYGTGYYWDGMDSLKQLLLQNNSGGGGGSSLLVSSSSSERHSFSTTASGGGAAADGASQVQQQEHSSSKGIIIASDIGDQAKKVKKKKKKKRKKEAAAAPVMVVDPNNPLEQVAAVLQKRQQLGLDPTLPAGWQAAVDARLQRTYYFNRQTGERRWEKPVATTAATTSTAEHDKEAATAKSWKAAVDPNTQKTYYYNETTKETRWDKPTEME